MRISSLLESSIKSFEISSIGKWYEILTVIIPECYRYLGNDLCQYGKLLSHCCILLSIHLFRTEAFHRNG